jgi:hypothetical protein
MNTRVLCDGRAFAVLLFCAVAAETAAQNGALSLDAYGEQVDFAATPALAPSTGLTVEAWVRPTAGVLPVPVFDATIITSAAVPSVTPTFRIGIVQNVWMSGAFQVTAAPALSIGGNPGFLLDGAWHHLATTFDGTTARAYVDGQLVGSVTASPGGPPAFVAGTGRIGATISQQYGQYTGLIDEVRVWSHARSEAEIADDRFRVLNDRPGLVAAWHFDGDFSDSVGAHDGTPTAGVQIVPSDAPISSTRVAAAPGMAPGAPWVWRVLSEDADALYLLDGSVSGTLPGTPLGGGFVAPLNRPWLYLDVGLQTAPELFSGFFDVVGSDETGLAIFQFPDLPGLNGLVLATSAVVLDPVTFAVRDVAPPAYTVVYEAAPRIDSVSPAYLPAAGGPLTLVGENFQWLSSAEVGGVPATVTYLSPNSAIVHAPPSSPGARTVKFVNADGGTAFALDAFSYSGALSVLSAEPTSAPPGATVVVTGYAFLPGTTVAVGGVPATVLSIELDRLTFTVPGAAACDAPLTVQTPDGQSQSILWNPSPTVVTAINPQGPAAGGGAVMLLGEFPAGTTATVGGAPATVTAQTASALVLVAPPGAPGAATIVATGPTGCFATWTYLYL